MKRIIALVFVLLLLAPASAATASWLIDLERFSASVHRDVSCQDCHPDTAAKELHPDPADVIRPLSDFFNTESCFACHAAVKENLTQGSHGSLKIENSQKYSNCIECHDPHYPLRAGEKFSENATADDSFLTEADRDCMACHGLSPDDDPPEIAAFCFQCHARAGTRIQAAAARMIPLIDPETYQGVAHAELACLTCHPQAAAFNHDRQERADCRQCHERHDEAEVHDAHLTVSCQACHLNGVEPCRDPQSQTVYAQVRRLPGTLLEVHAMDREPDDDSCKRCHQPENRIGAAAMVLPPKGLLCLPCHASTFSAGGTIGFIALLIFAGGIVLTAAFVLSGSAGGDRTAGPARKLLRLLRDAVKTVFSRRFGVILRSLLLDVLLQRRLYRKSPARWLIHSLIFLSFGLRFSWGLLALLLSLWKPDWSWIWLLLDKNNPATGFLFDLSGIFILAGVTAAFIRGAQPQNTQPADLPAQDRLALGLIAGVVLVGFILEGMRIAMTGSPAGAGYAFAGYAVSRLFSDGAGLTDIYGYVWYLHALLSGAFIAYLPFSRLLHIIVAPAVLALAAVLEEERKGD